MKKILFSSMLAITLASAVSAQSNTMIYVQGGIKQSIYTASAWRTRLPFYGLQLGGGLSHHLKGKFYWYTGLHYATLGERLLINDNFQWGSEHDGNGNYQPNPDLPHRRTAEQHTGYLSARLGMGYYLTNNERFRLKAMPFADVDFVWTNIRDERLYMDEHQTIYSIMSIEKSSLRSPNLSAGLALSFEVKVAGQFDVFISPEATYQLFHTTTTAFGLSQQRHVACGLSIGAICRI